MPLSKNLEQAPFAQEMSREAGRRIVQRATTVFQPVRPARSPSCSRAGKFEADRLGNNAMSAAAGRGPGNHLVPSSFASRISPASSPFPATDWERLQAKLVHDLQMRREGGDWRGTPTRKSRTSPRLEVRNNPRTPFRSIDSGDQQYSTLRSDPSVWSHLHTGQATLKING